MIRRLIRTHALARRPLCTSQPALAGCTRVLFTPSADWRCAGSAPARAAHSAASSSPPDAITATDSSNESSELAAAQPSLAEAHAYAAPSALSKRELRLARQSLPTLRPKLYAPPPMSYKERMLYPVRRAIGAYSKWAVISENAATVYRSIEEQATVEAWYTGLGLPRSFMIEHSLLALHVWMLHRRHVLDFWETGEFSGRSSDQELFNTFWADTTKRVRALGVVEMSVNKQVENIQKATLVDLFELDAGLACTDDENLTLAGALYRGLFQQDPDIPAERVLLMADWVRREVWNILTQPAEDVYRGWITWSPVLGETLPDRLTRQRQLFDGSTWKDAVWIDGKTYFANPVTGERTRSLADVPPGQLTARRRWNLIQHMAEMQHAGELPAAYQNDPALQLMQDSLDKQAQLNALAEAEEFEEEAVEASEPAPQIDAGPGDGLAMTRAQAEGQSAARVWAGTSDKAREYDEPGAYPRPDSK